MANPWDPLPLPVLGDPEDRTVFEALGRTLNRWEFTEFALSILYSLFVGDYRFGKMQEYGKPNIFKDRIGGLERAAAEWFTRFPDQNAEGEFDSIVKGARGFANRRNEIAHGLVVDVRQFAFWRDKMKLADPDTPQFIVAPPYYLARKHDAKTGMPVFGYSSVQLGLLSQRFSVIEIAIDKFKRRCWPNEWPGEWLSS